jgi:hypothetical protein
MIIWHQCEKCLELYRSPEEAWACENKVVPVHNYRVGDFVKVKGDSNHGFIYVVITAFIWNHKAAYSLSGVASVGDRTSIGADLNMLLQNGDSLYEGYDFLPATENYLERFDMVELNRTPTEF